MKPILFAMLAVILIVCLFVFTRRKKPATVEEAARAMEIEPAQDARQAQGAQEEGDEIAAVIAAVMALVTAQAGGQLSYEEVIEGFHVRRIRRIPSVSQWGKAGREELLSSKSFN